MVLNTAVAATEGALHGGARDDVLLGTNSRTQRCLKWSLLTIHLIAMFYQIKCVFPPSCMVTHKMMAAVVLSCLKNRYFFHSYDFPMWRHLKNLFDAAWSFLPPKVFGKES